jgi:carboxypeptidase Taq
MSWELFEARMHELKDLDGVLGILSWDEETYAPPKGRIARGDQTSTVESIRHQRLVDPKLGELIDSLSAKSLGPAQSTCVQRMKRQRDLAVKVPESLVKETAIARSASLPAWQEARKNNDFPHFKPHLDRMLSLLRQKADALAPASGDRYDALLDEHEPEMTRAQVEPVLRELREGLVPLVEAIVGSGKKPRRDFLARTYPEQAQWDVTMRLLRDLGFDFERGRQDRSAHPFTGGASRLDVRVTTRIFENNPLSAIFSTIHEAGHGLYEQGFDQAHYRTALAAAPSMGIHESQSRLWENQIGRSKAFWEHYLPAVKTVFPKQLSGVSLEEFYAAVNIVEPSLVRVDADEVTYNLHILVRFEIELALVSGDLPTADLPTVWREKMRSYLGVVPPTDADGCLQDIHWAWGSVGYFPTYTLGNLWSAQIMNAYQKHRPQVWDDVRAGTFAPLLGWLRENIHGKGYLRSAKETVEAATGEPLKVVPFLSYLRSKYRELYGV